MHLVENTWSRLVFLSYKMISEPLSFQIHFSDDIMHIGFLG